MGFPSGAVFIVPLVACALAAIDVGETGSLANLAAYEAFADEEGESCEGDEYGVTCCCGSSSPQTCLEPHFDEVIPLQAGIWTVVAKKERLAAQSTPGPPHDRMVIFRLSPGIGGYNESGNASLVLVNPTLIQNSTLRGLRALEARAQGGIVRDIVATNADNDHYLVDYMEHFPNAIIHLAGRTALDESVRAPPDVENRTMEINLTFPLFEFRPELHMQLISGLRQPFPLYRNFSFTETPKYEFFFYHKSTKTLALGELMWYHSCDWPWWQSIQFPGLRKNKVHVWNYFGSTLFADAAASADSLGDMLAFDFERFLSLDGELGAIPDASLARQMVQVSLEGWWGPLPDFWLKLARVVLAVLLLVPCVVSCINDCPCARLRRPGAVEA